jgi:Spy/CpxP family protein refolding chaperone
MKDSILKYVLIVSVLLNVSLLGTAAYTHYKQTRLFAVPFVGPAGMLGRHAAFSSGMLFEELSLNPEQTELFHQKAVVFHEDINKKRREVDRLRISLLALMRADNPDKKAIEMTITQINTMQEGMQKMVVSHMLEFRSMLNKDQQKKFLDLIEGAMAQHTESACP